MFISAGFIITSRVSLILYAPWNSLGTGLTELNWPGSSGTYSNSPTIINVAIPGAVSSYTSTDIVLEVPSN